MNRLQMACVWRPACFAKPRAKVSSGTVPIQCSARRPFVRWLLPLRNSRNTKVTSRHRDVCAKSGMIRAPNDSNSHFVASGLVA